MRSYAGLAAFLALAPGIEATSGMSPSRYCTPSITRDGPGVDTGALRSGAAAASATGLSLLAAALAADAAGGDLRGPGLPAPAAADPDPEPAPALGGFEPAARMAAATAEGATAGAGDANGSADADADENADENADEEETEMLDTAEELSEGSGRVRIAVPPLPKRDATAAGALLPPFDAAGLPAAATAAFESAPEEPSSR